MGTTAQQLLAWPPEQVPERIVAAVEQEGAVAAGLYALDLEGRVLTRMAGTARLPDEVWLPKRVGPVAFRACEPELDRAVAATVPGARVHPLWLGGQASAMVLTETEPRGDLTEVLHAAAIAVEVAARHTDVFHTARRRKRTTPAAELQQELLPPPIVQVDRVELAASILPAYTVGGDWFDWTRSPGELRFSIGDAVGRGEGAMALGAVALSANRSARRRDLGIEEAAAEVNDAVRTLGREIFVTCVLARWDEPAGDVTWVRCGHPTPLLLRADGTLGDLSRAGYLPLGYYDERPSFSAEQTSLEPGDRLILYSDGITEARTRDGSFLGIDGLVAGAREGTCAASTVRGVLDAVERASTSIDDDATLVVLRRAPDD